VPDDRLVKRLNPAGVRLGIQNARTHAKRVRDIVAGRPGRPKRIEAFEERTYFEDHDKAFLATAESLEELADAVECMLGCIFGKKE
jgi:formylmethanofuran dehydrogenase subunit E